MVNVSRKKIPEKIFKKIFELLYFLLKHSNKKENFIIIINEFFTPKEKILLAKRITIIYLLLKKIEQKNICKILSVSKDTVSKYNLLLQNKNLKIIRLLKNKIFKEKVIYLLDKLLAELLIQPGIKKGHWQLYWQQKNKEYQNKTYGL